jgi:hypothetical protein
MRLFNNTEDLGVIYTALKTQMNVYLAQIGEIDKELKAKDNRKHREMYSTEFQEACNNMEHCRMLMNRIEAKTKGLDYISVP